MRKPGDTDKPPFVFALKGREFAHYAGYYFNEISEDGSKIRSLGRNDKGEVKDMTPQNTTEPRRVR